MVTCVQEGVVELQCENDLAEAEREDLSVMPMRRISKVCKQSGSGGRRACGGRAGDLPAGDGGGAGAEGIDGRGGESSHRSEYPDHRRADQSKLCGKTADCHGNGIRYPERSRSDAGIRREKLAVRDIIITKWIGLEGTADLAARNREIFLRDTRRIWWKKQRRLTGIILFYRRPLPP